MGAFNYNGVCVDEKLFMRWDSEREQSILRSAPRKLPNSVK